MNSVNLIGNLTRAPELRMAGETAVTTLRLAFSTRAKRGEEWVDESNYIDVTVWGRQAELAVEHLEKGRQVAVTGTLKTREYESTKYHDGDGQAAKISQTEIVASDLQYLSKPKGEPGDQPAVQPEAEPALAGDDIPY